MSSRTDTLSISTETGFRFTACFCFFLGTDFSVLHLFLGLPTTVVAAPLGLPRTALRCGNFTSFRLTTVKGAAYDREELVELEAVTGTASTGGFTALTGVVSGTVEMSPSDTTFNDTVSFDDQCITKSSKSPNLARNSLWPTEHSMSVSCFVTLVTSRFCLF